MGDDTPIVFIVDDDSAVRDSLALLVRSIGLQAETFNSATEFLAAYRPPRWGCLLLDVRMPGMSGLELQERLLDLNSSLPIIFISAHGDVPMAVHAIRSGAVDFIQKPFRDQELLDKIQHAIDHHERVLRNAASLGETRARIESLTPRERDVMHRVVDGKPNKVIAAELRISQRTVEIHRARVMAKMHAESLADLVRMVVASGD
jgi:FixJ family two-component response regulator